LELELFPAKFHTHSHLSHPSWFNHPDSVKTKYLNTSSLTEFIANMSSIHRPVREPRWTGVARCNVGKCWAGMLAASSVTSFHVGRARLLSRVWIPSRCLWGDSWDRNSWI